MESGKNFLAESSKLKALRRRPPVAEPRTEALVWGTVRGEGQKEAEAGSGSH